MSAETTSLADPVAELVSQVHDGALPSPRRRREIRQRAEVTLTAVARALGVSYATMQRWEKGTQEPQRLGQERIAYARLLAELDRVNREAAE